MLSTSAAITPVRSSRQTVTLTTRGMPGKWLPRNSTVMSRSACAPKVTILSSVGFWSMIVPQL